MCGIAGIIHYKGNPVDEINRMNNAMIRRGPDDEGYFLDENRKVVLGHRRLSIVDVSKNGAQPMKSDDDRYVIVYNGETYNAGILKADLVKKGIVFRGTSDTEVILEHCISYGVKETLTKMKGMFSFAFYDREKKEITLARDRVGEKPLYYGTVSGQFVFASDLSSVKALSSFNSEICTEVLPLYFHYGYIPAPYTIYRGLWKLEPGHVLTISVDSLGIQNDTYWDMKLVAKSGENNPFTGSEEEAAEELERLLKESVKGQMISDVPLGAFLSGGVDSSLVVAMCQAVSERPVKTFTIGMDVKGYNEAEYAAEVARILGTEHTAEYITRKEAVELVPELPTAFSEPFADSSQIPTMLVSKMTRKHVTVALSGDGGDELFCGYNSYLCAEKDFGNLRRKYQKLPNGINRLIGKTALGIPGENSFFYKAGNYLMIDSLEKNHRYLGLEDSRVRRLVKGQGLPCENDLYEEGFLKEPVHNLMLMDMLQYHPDDILTKVDRSGMFYSLESRIPLLDKDIVEFAWKLPLSYKFDGKTTKKVMRDVLYKYVPKEYIERPKKGFSIPLKEWLSEGSLYEWAENVISEGTERFGYIADRKTVLSYWSGYKERKEYSETLWYILMLYSWLLNEKQ